MLKNIGRLWLLKKRKLTIEDRIGVAIMDTKVEVVTLKSGSNIIFKEIKNSVSNKLGIVYGEGALLYSQHVITEKTDVWQYTSYITEPVQLFRISNVIDRRLANAAESSIFDKLSTNVHLDKEDREYLRNNYRKEE